MLTHGVQAMAVEGLLRGTVIDILAECGTFKQALKVEPIGEQHGPGF